MARTDRVVTLNECKRRITEALREVADVTDRLAKAEDEKPSWWPGAMSVSSSRECTRCCPAYGSTDTSRCQTVGGNDQRRVIHSQQAPEIPMPEPSHHKAFRRVGRTGSALAKK